MLIQGQDAYATWEAVNPLAVEVVSYPEPVSVSSRSSREERQASPARELSDGQNLNWRRDRNHPLDRCPGKPQPASNRLPARLVEEQVIRHLPTKAISNDQLAVEVGGIYAALCLVEQKCDEVDKQQMKSYQLTEPPTAPSTEPPTAPPTEPLTDSQWSALVALHKTLLYEHHDFYLASQHPSANPPLRKLADQYSMPARLWKYGIYAFLEVLRSRLPESRAHMEHFIFIAFSTMCMLYETVPAFEGTWAERLGDIARYGMSLAGHDIKERSTWSRTARFWYSKTADECPKNGRLYHHLAILAEPHTLEQLSHFTRALTSIDPYLDTWKSMPTLLGTMHTRKALRQDMFITAFLKINSILVLQQQVTEEATVLLQWCTRRSNLESWVEKGDFLHQGISIAMVCIALLLRYWKREASGDTISEQEIPRKEIPSKLWLFFAEIRMQERELWAKLKATEISNDEHDVHTADRSSALKRFEADIPRCSAGVETDDSEELRFALTLTFTGIFSTILRQPNDESVYSYIHVMFRFIANLHHVPKALESIVNDLPLKDICCFLNSLRLRVEKNAATSNWKIYKARNLPEYYVMRGQIWYWPDADGNTDLTKSMEERVPESRTMAEERIAIIYRCGQRFEVRSRHGAI